MHCTTLHEINKEHLRLLISHGYFTTKARYVCGGCLNYAGEKLSAGEHLQDPQTDQINVLSNDSQSFEHSQKVQCVAKMIESGKITQEYLVFLCKTIGNVLNNDVHHDRCLLKGAYKVTNNIISSDCDSYLDDRPKVPVEFLRELTGVTSPNAGRKTYSLCLAIVHIYSMRNLNFIGPYSLIQELIEWRLLVVKPHILWMVQHLLVEV